MPGVWTWSGSSSPGSTSSSTSAMVMLAGGGHHRVEVARGLAEDEVAAAVALPRLDDAKSAVQRALEHVVAPVELARLLALGDQGADAGRREERGDAGAAGADALGERALRVELDLELARRNSRSNVLFSPT